MEGQRLQHRLQMQAGEPLPFLCAMGFHQQAYLPGRQIEKAIGFLKPAACCLLLQLPEVFPAAYLSSAGG